ncbi:hypothetical protein LCGC14_0747870 [marine sediment metagenome]|uniref:Uncharacterized protein n=1 Tax=marine sediment metagenome TaxID=412755 RepID=A0A0F9Q4V9_9ZZZZ
MADEEFKDYGEATHLGVKCYLVDEFDITWQEAGRLIAKYRQTLLDGIAIRDKAVDVGDRIMEKEPAT